MSLTLALLKKTRRISVPLKIFLDFYGAGRIVYEQRIERSYP